MESESNRIPSNILLKSAYYLYLNKSTPKFMNQITDDLYNYISNLDPLYWNNLEIEAKLGKFDFVGPCVYGYNHIYEVFKIKIFDDPNFSYYFISGLDEKQFFTIWKAIDNESSIPGAEIIRMEPENTKEQHYKSGKRKALVYKNGEVIREEIIRKEDKMQINIRNCGNDFRITSCKEMPTDITDDDVQISTRDKFRVSYQFKFFRLDFTIAKTGIENNISFEIELEFSELKTYLTRFEGKPINYDEFKVIISRFIQNIFCIYCSTSEDYYTMMSHMTKKRETSSLFGNYFSENIEAPH